MIQFYTRCIGYHLNSVRQRTMPNLDLMILVAGHPARLQTWRGFAELLSGLCAARPGGVIFDQQLGGVRRDSNVRILSGARSRNPRIFEIRQKYMRNYAKNARPPTGHLTKGYPPQFSTSFSSPPMVIAVYVRAPGAGSLLID